MGLKVNLNVNLKSKGMNEAGGVDQEGCGIYEMNQWSAAGQVSVYVALVEGQ